MKGHPDGELRLFFALWPDSQCRDSLHRAVRPLLAASDGRQVPVENYHLTLQFPGYVARDRLPLLLERANRVAFPPFELTLDRFGHFEQARAAWYGCNAHPVALSRLVADLRLALYGIVELTDHRRPFCPHVTVLRKQRQLPCCSAPLVTRWSIRDFVLVESRLGQGRANYSVLRRFCCTAGQEN